jgi:hypothetical protein
MGDSEQFVKVGSASDVENVNSDKTNQFWNTIMGNYSDPNSAFRQFMSQAPELQNLIFGATSPLQQRFSEYGDIMANSAIKDVANQFSGIGGLNSGAAISAATRGAAEPRANLLAQLGQTQAGMLGNLFSGAMSGNYGLQQTGLQAGAQMAAPEWWQPTWMENPDYISTGDWLQMGASVVGGLGGAALGLAGLPATSIAGKALGF